MSKDSLCRSGKLKCPKGHKMKMYYTPWCPVCEPPEIENTPTINFIQMLEHLEAIGHKGIKDRVFEMYSMEIKNDTSFYMGLDDPEEHMCKDTLIIKKFLGGVDGMTMHVSW